MIGDWDGDGKADPAVFRNSVGGAESYFYFRGSAANPGGNITYLRWGDPATELFAAITTAMESRTQPSFGPRMVFGTFGRAVIQQFGTTIGAFLRQLRECRLRRRRKDRSCSFPQRWVVDQTKFEWTDDLHTMGPEH